VVKIKEAIKHQKNFLEFMGLVTILIVKQEMVEAPDIKRKKIQVVQQIVVTIYCKDHINTRKEM